MGVFPFLQDHGVLGLNARNLLYIGPFNPDRAIAFADSKLKTKAFLEARGIPVPRLLSAIRTRKEARAFDLSSLPDSCVLKPNYGYGGQGICVLVGRHDGTFFDVEGRPVTDRELVNHIEDILDARYALNHTSDIAFFEQRLRPAECLLPLHPHGLPDIRIIVFNLVPVMAMLRIPTVVSAGKANVHLGGIGIGIDLAKGVTTHAAQYNERLRVLPDGTDPAGRVIPAFEDLLLIASRVQQITNIGFLAVDLTLDADDGPLLLEVNARAGLMVQVANLAPLRSRLERVQGLRVTSPEKGVRLAQDLFGERVESRSSSLKPVLGTRETIEISSGKRTIRAVAVLRPDHDRTVFDPSLLEELRSLQAVEPLETGPESGLYRVKFLLGGRKLHTVISPHHIREPGVRVSIGRRDLTSFVLDPGKHVPAPVTSHTHDLVRVDRQLADVDRTLQVLGHLRPLNLAEERERARLDPDHNPVYRYHELRFDPDDLLDRLAYLRGDDSPLGQLLDHKRIEILQRLALLRSRADTEAFTAASSNLYGRPTPSLLREARTVIAGVRPVSGGEEPTLPAEEVQERLRRKLQEEGLYEWQVILTDNLIADCAIGRRALLIRRSARFSATRVASLIAHEVETHVMVAENGRRQPFAIFERGLAHALETQEGLAVVQQERVLPPQHEKRGWPALGVLAVSYALSHSFAETRAYIRRLGFSDQRALRTCEKVKRGLARTVEPGGFTRELVYLRGALAVRAFIAGGGDLRRLYVGRVSLEELPICAHVKELLPPLSLPLWLRERGEKEVENMKNEE